MRSQAYNVCCVCHTLRSVNGMAAVVVSGVDVIFAVVVIIIIIIIAVIVVVVVLNVGVVV